MKNVHFFGLFFTEKKWKIEDKNMNELEVIDLIIQFTYFRFSFKLKMKLLLIGSFFGTFF